ncbi:MAG: von Willebrand factor type A domain-containing protein [Phycisphaerales bacterium]
MNREQAEKLLAAMVFDDLDESSKAELLTYLQTDDDLRDRLADMRMAIKLTCDAVNDGPDPVLAERRLKKLRQLARAGGQGSRVFLLRRFLTVAAVLCVGVVLVGLSLPSLNKVRRYSASDSARARAESARLESMLLAQDAPSVSTDGSSASGTVHMEVPGVAMDGRASYGGGVAGRMGGMASSETVAGEIRRVRALPREAPLNSDSVTTEPSLRSPSVMLRRKLPSGTESVRGSPVTDEAVAQIEQEVDPYHNRPEGPGISNALVVAPEASPPSQSEESSSSRIANGDMDRLREALESRKTAARSTVGVGVLGARRLAEPVTTPVPAQPVPTADEKSDTNLDFFGGLNTEDGRVPALGDTPILGRLYEFEPQGDKDKDAQGSVRKERPDSTLPTATRSDQLVIADREEAVALKDAPGLDTAVPSFESRFTVATVNPWVMTERDAQSTFALDVDTASYALCRRYIRSGFLPPIGAVRMEEFINAFDYAYPQRDGATFAVYAEGAPSPFAPAGQDLTLLKIAVKARTVGRDQRRAAHIVFVVDASASMGQPDRLPLVQSALSLLVDKLDDTDRISLVTCADEARLHLEAVPAKEKETIRRTIDAIQPAGRTNLLAGLKIGYDLARRAFVAGRINQVVLCSDGVANVGQTEADGVLAEVADDRKQGITLTCVGVGYGAYDDAFLETMADRGDGRYVFLDSSDEARETLVGQLAATLQTVAKDARIQVQFNAARVRRYRLIGYENRDIEDRRFRDDTVDAGEVGSGQCSTALYEMELIDLPAGEDDGDLGTVFVRYRNADTGQIEEISRPLAGSLIRRRSVEEDPRFFLAVGAARFAEWLRQSEHARDTSPADIQDVLDRVSAALPLDRNVQDLAVLAHQAENLPRVSPTAAQP